MRAGDGDARLCRLVSPRLERRLRRTTEARREQRLPTVLVALVVTFACDVYVECVGRRLRDRDVPLVLGINDDVVYIGVENETGALVALIETSDETVSTDDDQEFETETET